MASPVATAPGQQVLALAVREIGKPYSGPIVGQPDSWRWGSPGWDCSSFVAGMYRDALGVKLTAFTDAAYSQTVPVADPLPGDIVFYRYDDPSQPGVRYPHMGLWVDEQTTLDARYPEGVGYHPHVRRGTIEVRRPTALVERDGDYWRERTRVAARAAGIDVALFVAMINQESRFDPEVIYCRRDSPAGARGIAQIVSTHHPTVDPCDPEAALRYAALWMGELLRMYFGNWTLALVHYNGGGGAVAAWQRGEPYAESRAYVRAILGE